MATTYQGPFLIQFVGNPLSDVCLQAQYAGADANVTIQPIDVSGSTTLQQWFRGSDGRFYLNTGTNPPPFCLDYVLPAANGAQLIIAGVNLTDQTQLWDWHGYQPTASTFNNVAAYSFSIDLFNGDITHGNKVQLWKTQNGNTNQAFTMSVMPAFAPK